MVEKLLSTAGLHKLLKERKEFEVTVKINSKELSLEDKGIVFTPMMKICRLLEPSCLSEIAMYIFIILFFQLIAHRSLMTS
jgi:hypothetical protein